MVPNTPCTGLGYSALHRRAIYFELEISQCESWFAHAAHGEAYKSRSVQRKRSCVHVSVCPSSMAGRYGRAAAVSVSERCVVYTYKE